MKAVVYDETMKLPEAARLPFTLTLLQAVELSRNELNVFAVLLANKGRIAAEELRARADVSSQGAMRMAITRLREKLAGDVTINHYRDAYELVSKDG